MEQWLSANPNTKVDYIFGQNDRMAMGARKAIANSPSSLHTPPSTLFCGIDGLPGENGGIRLVRDSVLNASYIYPTHGDKLLETAVNILEGKPYDKETKLMSALVTSSNANVLLMQAEETMHQTAYLDQLHQKADGYLQQLDTQRTITMLAVILIALLLIVIVLFYLYHLGRIKQQREHVVSTLWNMKTEDIPAPEEVKDDNSQESDNPEAATTSLFISRFKEVVEKRLTDSELSVEDLAADMNLSRVQLYRKVKATTGSTPIELLRTARLNRGYQLLLTTEKSVSEIAYEVGFTAPSYFTKCFKDEYGQLPGDVKK
jgi:AraC-like DNA-binding protein